MQYSPATHAHASLMVQLPQSSLFLALQYSHLKIKMMLLLATLYPYLKNKILLLAI
jgi:hypothetical protein